MLMSPADVRANRNEWGSCDGPLFDNGEEWFGSWKLGVWWIMARNPVVQ